MSMLSTLLSRDFGISVLKFITICDIFALSFVSTGIRTPLLGLTRKTKCIRKAAYAGLLSRARHDPDVGDAKFVMDMLEAGRGFVSGSMALQIILHEHWTDYDLDLYFPNKAACELVMHEYHGPINRSLGGTSPYSINKFGIIWAENWFGPGKSCDIMDASLGDPNDFYMTMVQNWLWFDGRIRVLDPWAIVHRQQKFTNLCKREILAQATMLMSETGSRIGHSVFEVSYFRVGERQAGRPLGVRLELLEARVKKYNLRGFTLSNDLLQYCGRNWTAFRQFVDMKYPALVYKVKSEESKVDTSASIVEDDDLLTQIHISPVDVMNVENPDDLD
jgi:hypothetical protein